MLSSFLNLLIAYCVLAVSASLFVFAGACVRSAWLAWRERPRVLRAVERRRVEPPNGRYARFYPLSVNDDPRGHLGRAEKFPDQRGRMLFHHAVALGGLAVAAVGFLFDSTVTILCGAALFGLGMSAER